MIAITGATGQLGRHVVEQLLERVDPTEVVLTVRSPEKAADLEQRGVELRYADYTEPESFQQALEGVDKLLLISASDIGERFEQHRNVIEAAVENEVEFIAYTSILGADSSEMSLAKEHRATEEMIRDTGITYAFLRNGWYIENYTDNLEPALEHGALLGSAGDGKISAATRRDFAAAAVEVLTGEGHDDAVYNLAGDEAFTMKELAAEISRQSGVEVVYKDMPADDYKAALEQMGLPEPVANMLSESDLGMRRGEMYDDSGDLSRLIGRPTTSMQETVAQTLDS